MLKEIIFFIALIFIALSLFYIPFYYIVGKRYEKKDEEIEDKRTKQEKRNSWTYLGRADIASDKISVLITVTLLGVITLVYLFSSLS